MATTYERQTTPSPATDDTVEAIHLNSEFDYLIAALNDFDASNCKKSGTSIPLANITGLTSTQMAAAFFLDEDDMASNSATAVSSQQAVKAHVAASSTDGWTPTSYTGGESVTFPNGLIFKQGIIARSAQETTVTFGTAFPTGAVSCNAVVNSTNTNQNAAEIKSLSTTTMVIRLSAGITGYYWQAWGY